LYIGTSGALTLHLRSGTTVCVLSEVIETVGWWTGPQERLPGQKCGVDTRGGREHILGSGGGAVEWAPGAEFPSQKVKTVQLSDTQQNHQICLIFPYFANSLKRICDTSLKKTDGVSQLLSSVDRFRRTFRSRKIPSQPFLK